MDLFEALVNSLPSCSRSAMSPKDLVREASNILGDNSCIYFF